MVNGNDPFVDQLETQLKTNAVDNDIAVVFPKGYDSRLKELGVKN